MAELWERREQGKGSKRSKRGAVYSHNLMLIQCQSLRSSIRAFAFGDNFKWCDHFNKSHSRILTLGNYLFGASLSHNMWHSWWIPTKIHLFHLVALSLSTATLSTQKQWTNCAKMWAPSLTMLPASRSERHINPVVHTINSSLYWMLKEVSFQ